MKYKPDWPDAEERLTALWQGRILDRPCVAVRAPSGRNVPGPGRPHTAEQKWMDPDWAIPNLMATLENTWWGGEAVPSGLLMGGWVVSLGGRPRFDLATIWFDPFDVDFTKPSPFVVAPDDPWTRKHERLYRAAIDAAGWDDFLVGSAAILPVNDLLSVHMGPQRFLMALVDEPEWMREAILRGARELLTVRRRLRNEAANCHRFWYGIGGWMPFWVPEPFLSTQSDVSCMLSPEMFERFIVPELDLYGHEFGALWYHLDGGDARQHLPRLLSLPYLRVVQYVPRPCEPPNGEGHLDLYREIQSAGRIVHVSVAPSQVEPLIRNLDPALLMLDVSCGSVNDGMELLAAAKRWVSATCVDGSGKPRTGAVAPLPDPHQEQGKRPMTTHTPTREEALALLREFNSNPSLIHHALAVEAAMRFIARKNHEDEEKWGIIGLVHDLDYERFPDQHCAKTKEILSERGWPEDCIRAAISHGWGICVDVEPQSTLEKTLYAVDELTGLITACALVRPSKSVMDLEADSVRKKWKQKGFAAGVNREVIEKGAQMLGVDLKALITDTILGMRTVASQIGLG